MKIGLVPLASLFKKYSDKYNGLVFDNYIATTSKVLLASSGSHLIDLTGDPDESKINSYLCREYTNEPEAARRERLIKLFKPIFADRDLAAHVLCTYGNTTVDELDGITGIRNILNHTGGAVLGVSKYPQVEVNCTKDNAVEQTIRQLRRLPYGATRQIQWPDWCTSTRHSDHVATKLLDRVYANKCHVVEDLVFRETSHIANQILVTRDATKAKKLLKQARTKTKRTSTAEDKKRAKSAERWISDSEPVPLKELIAVVCSPALSDMPLMDYTAVKTVRVMADIDNIMLKKSDPLSKSLAKRALLSRRTLNKNYHCGPEVVKPDNKRYSEYDILMEEFAKGDIYTKFMNSILKSKVDQCRKDTICRRSGVHMVYKFQHGIKLIFKELPRVSAAQFTALELLIETCSSSTQCKYRGW